MEAAELLTKYLLNAYSLQESLTTIWYTMINKTDISLATRDQFVLMASLREKKLLVLKFILQSLPIPLSFFTYRDHWHQWGITYCAN